MQVHGIVQAVMLCENPPGSDRIELVIQAQGVAPNKPRQIVVPFEFLVQDTSLDPDGIQGHGFEAEIQQEETGRWIVVEISFAKRDVLRSGGLGC
ncbi:MAG: hypothetical protein ACLP7Q_20745 [Isosphaeraceae bacterium]